MRLNWQRFCQNCDLNNKCYVLAMKFWQVDEVLLEGHILSMLLEAKLFGWAVRGHMFWPL